MLGKTAAPPAQSTITISEGGRPNGSKYESDEGQSEVAGRFDGTCPDWIVKSWRSRPTIAALMPRIVDCAPGRFRNVFPEGQGPYQHQHTRQEKGRSTPNRADAPQKTDLPLKPVLCYAIWDEGLVVASQPASGPGDRGAFFGVCRCFGAWTRDDGCAQHVGNG